MWVVSKYHHVGSFLVKSKLASFIFSSNLQGSEIAQCFLWDSLSYLLMLTIIEKIVFNTTYHMIKPKVSRSFDTLCSINAEIHLTELV